MIIKYFKTIVALHSTIKHVIWCQFQICRRLTSEKSYISDIRGSKSDGLYSEYWGGEYHPMFCMISTIHIGGLIFLPDSSINICRKWLYQCTALTKLSEMTFQSAYYSTCKMLCHDITQWNHNECQSGSNIGRFFRLFLQGIYIILPNARFTVSQPLQVCHPWKCNVSLRYRDTCHRSLCKGIISTASDSPRNSPGFNYFRTIILHVNVTTNSKWGTLPWLTTKNFLAMY